jgi:MoxR-like ATPase
MKEWQEFMGDLEIDDCETWEIRGKKIKIPPPEKIPDENYEIRPEIIEKALAAWMPLDRLPPMNFRLYGPSGAGKNCTVYILSRILNRDLYIMKVVDALNPEEDIACTMVMYDGTPTYVAQPLLAAMLRGGICFFDEIDKTPEAALVPLSSVLDDRRTLYSTLFGNRFKAHKDFLFCAALSEEAEEGNQLPAYIRRRTAPAIYVGHPDIRTLEKMLRSRLPGADDLWFQVFLRDNGNQGLTPADALDHLSFAVRLFRDAQDKQKVSGKISGAVVKKFLQEARETKKTEGKGISPEPTEDKKKEERHVEVPSLFKIVAQNPETMH